MSTKPRFEPAIAGQPADFTSIMGHVPMSTSRFFDLYTEFWQRGVVGPELKEITRIRNARITDCGY